MNCTDFELAVQDRLDERQRDLAPDLAAHVANCAHCRELWTGQQLLLQAMTTWADLLVPAGLTEAALAELTSLTPAVRPMAERVRAGQRGRTLFASAGSMICSLAALILIAVTLTRFAPPESSSTREVATSTEPSDTAVVSETLAGLWTGVRSEYQSLSWNPSPALGEWAELRRTVDVLPSFTPASGTDASPAEASREWLRIDRPVSDRAVQAFDFLWHALPQDGSQSS